MLSQKSIELVRHTDLVASEHLLSLDSVPDPSVFFMMQLTHAVGEESQDTLGGSCSSTFRNKQLVPGEGDNSSLPNVSQ